MTPIFWRIWLMKIMHVLVREIVGLRIRRRLAHQAGLQTDVLVANFALHLRTRYQGGHGINHDHIHGIGLDEHFGNLQRFLLRRTAGLSAGSPNRRLRRARARIQGVLRIDKSRDAA